MSTAAHPTDVLLAPGHWLGAWAWEEVAGHLRDAGFRPVPVTLPGLDPADPDRATRTLAEQAAFLLEALDAVGASEQQPAILVGHSGANAPISIVLDRRPELVARVIWVDSGPAPEGAPEPGAAPAELPLPPFEELGRQASLDGLSTDALAQFRSRAVPEPGPVLGGAIELHNDARLAVPTTLICCSITADQVRELATQGHPMFAEVARLHDAELIDLPTGHWPMWSRPEDLAATIASAIRR